MTTKRFRIRSQAGTDYGVYLGPTEEDAFRAMESDGGGSAGDISGWIIEEVLSRSAAKKQAHRDSRMYKQGSRWVVSTWDDAVGRNRVDNGWPFHVARQVLADWRRRRAAELQGL